MDYSNYLAKDEFDNLIYTPLHGIADREFFLGRSRSGCQSTPRYLLSLVAPKLAIGNAWAFSFTNSDSTAA